MTRRRVYPKGAEGLTLGALGVPWVLFRGVFGAKSGIRSVHRSRRGGRGSETSLSQSASKQTAMRKNAKQGVFLRVRAFFNPSLRTSVLLSSNPPNSAVLQTTLRRTSGNSPPYFDACKAESLGKQVGELIEVRRRVSLPTAKNRAVPPKGPSGLEPSTAQPSPKSPPTSLQAPAHLAWQNGLMAGP